MYIAMMNLLRGIRGERRSGGAATGDGEDCHFYGKHEGVAHGAEPHFS